MGPAHRKRIEMFEDALRRAIASDASIEPIGNEILSVLRANIHLGQRLRIKRGKISRLTALCLEICRSKALAKDYLGAILDGRNPIRESLCKKILRIQNASFKGLVD